MHIEVLIEDNEPLLYEITKDKTVIGSGETADIVIADESVSRKHLVLLKEGDDKFLVYDTGSVNGSYVNEERLIPGARTEFTSFFPVRLGTSVLINLIYDVDSLNSEETRSPLREFTEETFNTEATKVISLKDLGATSTKALVEKRKEFKSKTKSKESKTPLKKETQKKSSTFKPLNLFIAFILLAATYYTFNNNKSAGPLKKSTENKKNDIVEAAPAPVYLPVPSFEKVQSLFEKVDGPKCSLPEEKILCESIKEISSLPWGASVLDNSIVVFKDVTQYYSEIKSILEVKVEASAVPDEKKVNDEELWDLTIGKFFHESFNNDDYLKIKNRDLVFAFFIMDEGAPRLKTMTSLSPGSLHEVRTILASGRFNYLKKSGAKIMNFKDRYYKIYF